MCFNYTFLLTNFYSNNFVPAFQANSVVIIPVSPALWEQKKTYLEKLNSNEFTFCFAILNATNKLKRSDLNYIQDSLSAYFFLPNYQKNAGAYLIVADADRKEDSLSIVDIEKTLAKQGIMPLSKNYVSNSEIDNLNADCFYSTRLINTLAENNASGFDGVFKDIVIQNGTNKQIVIPIKDEADFKEKKQAINNFENWITENESSYVELLSAFKKINAGYLKLYNENAKLRFRISNYNDYLKLLRETAIWHADEFNRVNTERPMVIQNDKVENTGNQMAVTPYNINDTNKEIIFLRNNREEILRWYSKEYEVLPLWYKRFGHIIKIVSGKRKIKDYL